MKRHAILLALATLAAGAQANVVSNFDAGIDGWSTAAINPDNLAILGAGTPTWDAGRLKATEIPGGLFVLVAPNKFVGDRSSYFGGSVSYFLADEIQNTNFYYSLFLHGNGLSIAYLTPAPSVSGRNYTVPLTSAGWFKNQNNAPAAVSDAEFKSVLAGLDIMAINGDWTGDLGNGNDHTDRVTLDNVVLAAPVPEPGTICALGLGVAGFLRKRAKR